MKDYPMPNAAKLYERANAASADAIRLAKENPGLACQRRRDATALRAMARAQLTT